MGGNTKAIAVACAGLVLGALALVPGRAEACSCADPRTRTNLLSPADGATSVPRNARVLLGGRQLFGQDFAEEPRAITLVDAEGEVVPTTQTGISGVGTVAALHPEALLEAGARYEVRAGDEVLSRFTVGEDVDESPPAPPTVVGVETQSSLDHLGFLGFGSSCGPTATARFALEGTGLFTVAVLDGEEGAFDAESLVGEVAALETEPVLIVGKGACAVSWPEARPFAGTNVRFGTFDAAGNFSGWSEARGVVLPPPGCRCDASTIASGGAPLGGVGLLLGLVGLLCGRGFRRRRAGGCSGSPGTGSSGRSAP